MLSTALTVLPPAEETGTVKLAITLPFPSLTTVTGLVKIGEPSKVIAIMLEARNPDPVTNTLVPADPEPGERMTLLAIVKVVLTTFEPSIASIMCDTGSPGGAEIMATKAPLLSVNTDEGDVGRRVPSHFTVTMAEGEKPYPVRVIFVPTDPLVGNLEREDVTVNGLVTELTPSLALTV
jgi:hypothetical protein